MKRTPSRPLGAQISHMLKHRGVDVIFGIPGVHNQEMYRGIEEAGITHFLARHEQGAGFMADGYARATGGFGVCYLITGPGMLNALTPLGQAYSDNVSVLALCSCLDNVVQRKGQLHQMTKKARRARSVTGPKPPAMRKRLTGLWTARYRISPAAIRALKPCMSQLKSWVRKQPPRPKRVREGMWAFLMMQISRKCWPV